MKPKRKEKKKNLTNNIAKSILATAVLALSLSMELCGCQHTTTVQTAQATTPTSTPEPKLKTNYTLDLGETLTLPAVKGKSGTYSSKNTNIVTVSQKGTLHAKKSGQTKVRLKIKGKDITYTIKVRKRGMVYPSFSMMKGEHLKLAFSYSGLKAKWTSANPSIASVTKKGNVTAKKKGSTILTGVAANNKKYRCKIKVTKRIKSVIYLTFDDGPNRYTTPKILKILKKHNVKATFFELKPARKDFDLTKRVLADGHTLALHGYQHKYDIIYRSEKVYHQNLDKLRNLFFRKYGVWCTVSRFPGGSSNTCSRYNKGIMTRLTKKLDSWGYHYFDWNADSCDAGGARNANEVFRHVKNSLVKGRGNVVLMHDFYKNDKTINALDRIIRYGKKHGYTFLPITASTTEVHHGVNN